MGNVDGRTWDGARLEALRAAWHATLPCDSANAFWAALGERMGMTGAAASVACGRNGLSSRVKAKGERARRTYARGG